MQAHHMLQRLLSAPLNQNVLKHCLERPLTRSASTESSARNSEIPRATPSSPHTSTNEQNQYTDDGSITFRNRMSDGSSKPRPLPLPPLMDPIALSARERWTEPKKPAPTRKEDLTPFQRKLYTNPYGRPLAHPQKPH
ncbi:hypothetical protein MPH_12341 [Macrophomina phaseolina MS6]|uniref:Uncharacterized protein n=1 Tax=Macrophomina phaseolina (strain MS6) TaxID=1126212 RepID=K2R7Z5_MACPH|nr:hypothetical protein MPH_12341 [Macrophomina phaseolina MS6]